MLVFSQGDSVIGLAVDRILDIVEDVLDMQLADASPGVLGTAVLKGESTEIIDLGYFLAKADPYWARSGAQIDETARPQASCSLIESIPSSATCSAPSSRPRGMT